MPMTPQQTNTAKAIKLPKLSGRGLLTEEQKINFFSQSSSRLDNWLHQCNIISNSAKTPYQNYCNDLKAARHALGIDNTVTLTLPIIVDAIYRNQAAGTNADAIEFITGHVNGVGSDDTKREFARLSAIVPALAPLTDEALQRRAMELANEHSLPLNFYTHTLGFGALNALLTDIDLVSTLLTKENAQILRDYQTRLLAAQNTLNMCSDVDGKCLELTEKNIKACIDRQKAAGTVLTVEQNAAIVLLEEHARLMEAPLTLTMGDPNPKAAALIPPVAKSFDERWRQALAHINDVNGKNPIHTFLAINKYPTPSGSDLRYKDSPEKLGEENFSVRKEGKEILRLEGNAMTVKPSKSISTAEQANLTIAMYLARLDDPANAKLTTLTIGGKPKVLCDALKKAAEDAGFKVGEPKPPEVKKTAEEAVKSPEGKSASDMFRGAMSGERPPVPSAPPASLMPSKAMH